MPRRYALFNDFQVVNAEFIAVSLTNIDLALPYSGLLVP